jgi:uncharacterized membrane protein
MSAARVRPRPSTVVALIGAAVAVRLAMVIFLRPLVDVYYYDAQAVSYLVSGVDPYGQAYGGIPAWLATPGAQNVYAYLPGVVLFLAPFGAVSDVRLGLVAADVVVSACILGLGGGRSRRAALAFMLAPWSFLFSTSYPDNTLVAMVFLGLYLLAETRNRGRPASVLLGVSVASSQFVWLVLPFFFVLRARGRRLAEAGLSVLTAALVIVPFAAWNYSAFVYDTLAFQFVRPVQSLVTQEAFGLNFNPTLSGIVWTASGLAVPLLLKAAIAAAALCYLLLKTRDTSGLLLNSSLFLLLSVFVLPDDFSWWYLELPFVTLLAWYATKGGMGPDPHANA